MHERVRGYTDAALEEVGRDIGPVAEQLRAFSRLLAASNDLRGALDNPALSEPVRRTIVHELLAKKVARPVLMLLTFAVQSGPSADYVVDVEAMASAGEAKRDGKVPFDEGPLGRTAAAERLDGYATSILAGVKERQLGDIEDELFRFMRIVEGNDELQAALTTGQWPAPVRQSIVHDLLARHGTPHSVRMASYAARIGRPRDYPLLLDGLVQRVAKEADRRLAEVRSAADMTQSERLRLAAALTRFAGYPVEVRVIPQPELLGGFVASVGDLVVDTSIRHRLQRAQELLAAPPAPGAGGTGGAPGASTEQ